MHRCIGDGRYNARAWWGLLRCTREKLAKQWILAQRVAASCDQRIDLLRRQRETRGRLVEHRGALRSQVVETHAGDVKLQVTAIPIGGYTQFHAFLGRQ